MELTQEIMDVFATGATKGGETNWSERDDAAGLRAVLEFIDPVPSDVQEMKDKNGGAWWRVKDDPLIWADSSGGCWTARQIINVFGGISWS